MLPLTHPNLTAFTLKSASEASLVELDTLTFINVPSLTELHLAFLMAPGVRQYNPNNSLASKLVDFSKHFRLTHLSLIRADLISPKELPVIINAFSSLRSFTFIAKKVAPKTFLQSLSCKKKDKQPVLPYLEYLRFGWYETQNFNALPKQLLEVVESRWLEEKMKRFHIHSRLMKVQIDRVIDRMALLPEVPLDQDELLSRFNAAENSRLQRLQAGGFTVAEDTICLWLEEDLV
ncbi:hypothetical protein BDP27DRAFT_1400063 [Rhodocollybia butyracea]|uniref:Uncharacterized protein n=1 Tax=Rhodocollybia butyracea TaxID=206335 RepID=A0A9P5Q2Z5_9AGAR|nr:hypothetical protein BDP27DRAFT_1400063 [Rhodocollybia butyracea]